MPNNATFEQAAAIPTVALTAWAVRSLNLLPQILGQSSSMVLINMTRRCTAGSDVQRQAPPRPDLRLWQPVLSMLCSSRLTACLAGQALKPDRIQPGQRVLIHAGAGGVGHMAIQLAKLKGAYVVTTGRNAYKSYLEVRRRSWSACLHACWLACVLA